MACSLTPSRMGIMTSRRAWSKLPVTGLKLAGVSPGRAGLGRRLFDEQESAEQRHEQRPGGWSHRSSYTVPRAVRANPGTEVQRVVAWRRRVFFKDCLRRCGAWGEALETNI